ncbi:MAG: hypothetical protein AB9891_13045 [Anaerolineaceae bacterium]
MEKIILAVDIGGTKTAVGAITTDGRILNRLLEPTLQNGPESGINQIIGLLDSLIQQTTDFCSRNPWDWRWHPGCS